MQGKEEDSKVVDTEIKTDERRKGGDRRAGGKTRVVIVDGHTLFRRGVRNILELEGPAGEPGGLGICSFKEAQLSHFAESEGDYLLAGGGGSGPITRLLRRVRSGKSPIKFVEW